MLKVLVLLSVLVSFVVLVAQYSLVVSRQNAEIILLPEEFQEDDTEPTHCCAFALLMYKVRGGVAKEAISSLQQYFNNDAGYPVVIFIHESYESSFEKLIQSFPQVDFELVHIDSKDWYVFPSDDVFPKTWMWKDGYQSPSFSVDYRLMSRYAAGHLFSHPALAKYEYVLKIDPDVRFTGPWRANPFVSMKTTNKQFGYWIEDCYGVHGRSVFHTFEAALTAYLEGYNKTLKQREIVYDGDSRFREAFFYGCFILARTALMRSVEYRTFFRYLDQYSGFLKYRWDEQGTFLHFVATHLHSHQVEWIDYVPVSHQVFSKPKQRMECRVGYCFCGPKAPFNIAS